MVNELRDWETGGPSGESVLVPAGFRDGPVARGVSVTFFPIGVSLIRPRVELPEALPALAGPTSRAGRSISRSRASTSRST